MIVTNIESLPQKKNKVYLDGDYAFMLYDRDIAVYGISEGMEMSDMLYCKITEDTVFRRAKQKAMAVLERTDKSEAELRRKLKEALYTDYIIDRTIDYLYGFHYLDDSRYARNYISAHMGSISRQELQGKLMARGISKDVIDSAFDELLGEDDLSPEEAENNAALAAMRKKLKPGMIYGAEELQKIYAYMYRKGFSQQAIRRAFSELEK